MEVANGHTGGTQPVNLGKSNLIKDFVFSCLDQHPNNKARGSPTHPSVERGNYKVKQKISTSKSAPTSIFPSPAVSPRRSCTGDPFVSGLNRHEHQESPSNNSPKVPSLKTPNSSQPSPLQSPAAQSSASNPRSSNDTPFPLHHKLQKNHSIGHVNAHPLPLPPPLVASSQSSPQSLPSKEKPYISSVKGQWQKGKLIGRGTFGSVYLATNRYECKLSFSPLLYYLYESVYEVILIVTCIHFSETGALCAMKEVDLIPDDPKCAESIKQLEQVLSHLLS